MSSSEPFSISEFQQLIRSRYYETDVQRGASATFLLFIEEVGELATALHDNRDKARPTPKHIANLSEEFADVFAWLCTLANIAGIDLTDALTKYTQPDRVKGVKG